MIQQCRKLLSVERLKKLLASKKDRYDVVSSLLHFFTFVYVFKTETNLPNKDLISILVIIHEYLVMAKKRLNEL